MPRPQFQQVITQVPGKAIRTISGSFDVGTYSNQTFVYANPNRIATVRAIKLYMGSYGAPDGDTHYINLSVDKPGIGELIGYLSGETSATKNISFNNGVFTSVDSPYPATQAAQVEMMKTISFTADSPLNITGGKQTILNPAPTVSLSYDILCVEEEIK